MSASRQVIGFDSIQAAEEVRKLRQQERKDLWPYIHEFPPPTSNNVNAISAAVAVPAKGVTVEVLAYTVLDGMRFFMEGIWQTFAGGNFLPGDLLWTVTVNKPGGISDSQGRAEQGLQSIPVPLGSWQFGVKWQFERAYEYPPNSVVRSMCLNSTGNISPGAPNLLVSGFFGYTVPDNEVKR